MEESIKRLKKDEKTGLNDEEVQIRKSKNLVNFNTDVKTKSAKQIVRENVVTLFNILNVILAGSIILVGSFKNVTFIMVIILNTLISTLQELHSKHIIDKLSVLSQNKVKVIRNKKEQLIAADEIVLDDIIHFELGNQIQTDSIIISGNVLVDESFITGEADHVEKKIGQMILSGSFIVSGNCYARVEHIGYDNYTAKITSDTKYIKPVSSEIMRSLNKIVKTISFVILPLAILLFSKQLFLANNTIQNAVVNTVAALIGMIPEGLVLLTSTVFAVSVIRLSKHQVLVQDLYCIETLARVDVICLDKTGTITEGVMEVTDVISVSEMNKSKIGDIIGAMMASMNDNNATAQALRKAYFSKPFTTMKEVISFSSEKKYSGVILEDDTTYLIGAAEFVLEKQTEDIKQQIDRLSNKGRVIILAQGKSENKQIKKIKPLGFIILQDKIRPEASNTLQYFQKQGVKVKVISGDNPITVAMVAKRAGLGNNLKQIDMSKITTEDFTEIVKTYNIFGRVKPEQKHLLIKALKENGNIVAMTGDGVNDCLALKEADCSIAMASGSDAARNVSQLVLLDSNFSSMPLIVDEGRRSINNLERSASLFLVKTIYAFLLAILFLFIDMPYPFIPIQLTLTSVLTIGIPSFILALEKNHDKVKGSFLKNVLKKSAPPAFTIVSNIILICCIGSIFNLSYAKISTLCLTLTGYTSFILLYKICRPFNRLRLILFFTMFYVFIYALLNLTTLFSISHFTTLMIIITFSLMFGSHQLYLFFEKLMHQILTYTKKGQH